MTINPMKWKTRNLAYTFLGISIFYIFFIYKQTYQVTYEDVIKNTKPQHVWEFVADFNNMLKLNSIIDDFKIIADNSNYDHWKYTVQYTEHLRNFPTIKNTALGHYSIKPHKKGYLISSEHRTCFFSNVFCLDTTSEFTFEGIGDDTKCVETVRYQCPLIFSIQCNSEVMQQRKDIMENLKAHFAMYNIKRNQS